MVHGGNIQTNTTAGFSIINYTGTGSNNDCTRIFRHINLVIVKTESGGNSWFSLGQMLWHDNQIIYMNNTDPLGTNATAFNVKNYQLM